MFKNYRLRITLIALALSVIVQSFCFYSGIISIRRINAKVSRQIFDNMVQYTKQDLSIKMSDINNILFMLLNSNAIIVATNNYRLRAPAMAKAAKETANNGINALNIPPGLVSSFFIIGENCNQECFAKRTSEKKWLNIDLPAVEDLKCGDLWLPFLKNEKSYFSVRKGEFTDKLRQNSTRFNRKQLKSLGTFFSYIEGHTVISYYNPPCIIVMVLGNDFERAYMTDDKAGSIYLTLLDGNMNPISGSAGEKHSITGEIAAKARVYKDTNDSYTWDSKIGNIDYANRLWTAAPYNVVACLTMPLKPEPRDFWPIMIRFLLLSFVTLAVTLYIAYRMTGWITGPIRTVVGKMRNNGLEIPLERLHEPGTDYGEGHGGMKRMSTRRKLMTILVISVILPSLVSCSICLKFIYDYSSSKLYEKSMIISEHIKNSLSYIIQSYGMENKRIVMDGFKDALHKYMLSGSLSDEKNVEGMIVGAVTPNNASFYSADILVPVNSFYYFMIIDMSGEVIYQSNFPNNPALLSISADMVQSWPVSHKDESFWIYIRQDMYNLPSTALVSRIILPPGQKGGRRQTIGYFLTFLNQNAFKSIRADPQMELIIMDDQGNPIFQSNTSNEFLDAAGNYGGDGVSVSGSGIVTEINRTRYFMLKQPVLSNGWNLFTFQRLNDIYMDNLSAITGSVIINAIMILMSVVLAFWLSRLLVRPLETIKACMAHVGDGSKSGNIAYEGNDEIGSLVESYNGMVERINQLLCEKLENQAREQQLISLKTQAELNMLQQQINPHFLYNALEVINSRSVMNGDDESALMAGSLARLFRYNISSSGMKTVSLKQELDHARNYLTIQEMRFKGKFATSWSIEENVLDARVLKLIIQPILENSINHGLYEYSSGGVISISSRLDSGTILIEISDNGIGMKEHELERLVRCMDMWRTGENDENTSLVDSKSSGIGLKNVCKRIFLYYGDKASIGITSRFTEGTTVLLQLPAIFE